MYPSQQLMAALASGQLEEDPEQLALAKKLDALIDAVVARKAQKIWRGWGRGWGRKADDVAVKGLYLWGGVGRGKSMLMDYFVRGAAADFGLAVKRFHFHDFMVAVHESVHQARQASQSDPTAKVMRALTEGADVVCFDEMEVRDIADAMILARVMADYMRLGGVVIATSNRHPDDLYKHGLQRARFLPFIAALKESTEIVEMRGDVDWRRRALAGLAGWYHPLNAASAKALGDAMAQLSGELSGGIEAHPLAVSLGGRGRSLTIPQAASRVGWIDFADICGVPLAAADYLVVAERFAGLLVGNIPQLTDALQNEARRFMWLVDALYEKKCFLIASAETDINTLYQGHQWHAEFPRTQSRLQEMSRLPIKA